MLWLPSLAAAQPAPRDVQIFLLIGQSNMVGRGAIEPQDREVIPRVYAVNESLVWQAAVDPLHWDNAAAGVGLGRSFARVLAALNPNVNIGLVPAAVGGTSLAEWTPGETPSRLYTEALRRLSAVRGTGTLRGVLWHQGERDSRDEVSFVDYLPRLGALFERLRRDLNAPDVPIVVGEIGEFLYTRTAGGYPNALAVNERLALAPVSIFRTAFVSSAGLGHIGDELHFNAESQREFGRRYALAYLSLDPDWVPQPLVPCRY